MVLRGDMQGDEVGVLEDLKGGGHGAPPQREADLSGELAVIVEDDVHAKRLAHLSDLLADVPKAHNPQRLPLDLVAALAVLGPLVAA